VQVKYLYNGYDVDLHVRVMSILGGWAVVSFAFQYLLSCENVADLARFGWAAADAACLTAVLTAAGPPIEPLLIGYPMLVAASGLFFRVRLVWFMTLATLGSYAYLLATGTAMADPPHYPMIFAATLAVLGFVVGYQVHRIRVLTRYYEHRRLP
jgi:hypothetical protein